MKLKKTVKTDTLTEYQVRITLTHFLLNIECHKLFSRLEATRLTHFLQTTQSSISIHFSFSPVHSFISSNRCLTFFPRIFSSQLYPGRILPTCVIKYQLSIYICDELPAEYLRDIFCAEYILHKFRVGYP